jgi:hypothetical protein
LSNDSLNGCDELLEAFHRNVEGEAAVEHVPATVIDVCRAQGTARYVGLADLEDSFESKAVPDYLFEDLILCAKDIYD